MATKHNDPCRDKAGDDEPIFTLRAQDRLSAHLVRLWADLAKAHGCPIEKVDEARATAQRMDYWANKKWPD